jgi:hypothetical protein
MASDGPPDEARDNVAVDDAGSDPAARLTLARRFGAALILLLLGAIPFGLVGPVRPDVKGYDSATREALREADINEASAQGAPQQQVVNGWLQRDLTLIEIKQNNDLLVLEHAIAAVLVAGSLAVVFATAPLWSPGFASAFDGVVRAIGAIIGGIVMAVVELVKLVPRRRSTIVIAAVLVLAIVIAVIANSGSSSKTVKAFAVGACVNDAPGNGTIHSVECSKPHRYQVVASRSLHTTDAFPGRTAASDEAQELCQSATSDYSTPTWSERRVSWVYPSTEKLWRASRDVQCYLGRPTPWTGSLLDGTNS